MLKKTEKTKDSRKKIRSFGKDLSFASIEAYNLLRTNLVFSMPDSDSGKVLGLTSPCPEDGKSTTSINLSYVLAEAGNKVLLIDADMRRPSLAKNIDLPMAPGLSNCLVENVSNAIHVGVLHENLSILLSGDIPPNPSELIGSAKMKSFVEEMRAKYDYVIFDLPPVNAVSDPLIMSKNIDGMIMVVRHNHTRHRDISEAVRQLDLVGAKILGFVYNGIYKTRRHYRVSHYSVNH